MRRSIEALAASLLVVALACGGGGEEADTGGEVAVDEEAGPAVSPDSAATITGVVNFTGTAPAGEPIDMSEEATCADQHTEPAMRTQVITADGKLANVFVYVKDGLGDRQFPVSQEGVTIDQQGCEYHPHVLGIQTGQDLIIKNSDGILHNINTQPSVNQGFNVSQPVAMETTKTFTSPEVMIPVKCDVHGWMEAFIGVQDHPYMAVTGADGTFTLENLPPGTYTIEAWHELYGTQTQTVTVAAQGTGEVAFDYSSDMAGRPVPMGEPIDLHEHGGDARVASAGR
ncbi:MAG TPA: carboxypeptidase regulatory-like domain-containing protein [Gemmatimonadota bacterium]|nr:carboxypeptidase regulatory-like domain-containing protein [Gemmatimonadota bacterium]